MTTALADTPALAETRHHQAAQQQEVAEDGVSMGVHSLRDARDSILAAASALAHETRAHAGTHRRGTNRARAAALFATGCCPAGDT